MTGELRRILRPSESFGDFGHARIGAPADDRFASPVLDSSPTNPPLTDVTRARSRRTAGLLLLVPCLLVLLALFVAPQALVFEASLGRRSAYGGVVHEWSAANYARALEPLYLGILARSVGLAAVTTAACLLVGLPGGLLAGPARAGALPQRAAGAGDPALLDELPGAHVRLGVRAAQRGARERGPAVVGLPALNLLYNDFAVLLGQVYGELPFMILPLFVSLEKLDRSLLEAAADLGATPSRALLRVTLPLIRPGIVAGCVLVFVPSLGAYLAPDLLGGARTVYIGNLIQSQFAVARDMPFGAALSFVLCLIVLALLFAVPAAAAHGPGGVSVASPRRAPVLGSLTALVYALPLRADPGAGRVLVQRGPAHRRVGGLHPATGTAELLANPQILHVAAQQPDRGRGATTVVCTLVGTAAALAFHRHRFRRPGAPRWRSSTLPIVVPEIVLASSLLLLFAALGLRLGFLTVILAHVAFSLSYAVVVVQARLPGFDRSLEEAAMDLGAGPWRDLLARSRCRASRPACWPAALLVFALSIDDYVITSFVAGVGSTTLPIQIYSMVRTRHHARDQRRLDAAAGGHQRCCCFAAHQLEQGARARAGGRCRSCWAWPLLAAPFVLGGRRRRAASGC